MTTTAPSSSEVATLRAFNRIYTQRLGLLNDRLDASPFSLTEARILYELAHHPGTTAAEIARQLDLDPGQLSRILAQFHRRRFLSKRASPNHAKHQLLSLTATGRSAFAELEGATNRAVGSLLSRFPTARRARLLQSATRLSEALANESVERGQEVSLRPLRVGDIGWVIHRQALLYAEEYGWDITYEALVAKILADFVEKFDAGRERAWIAELDGETVGSIFLKASEEEGVAKLRLLYVEPSARGHGIGRALVGACVEAARELGYRRLVLWTNSVLVSARRIYESFGFALESENAHHSFGQDLVGQEWSLDLS